MTHQRNALTVLVNVNLYSNEPAQGFPDRQVKTGCEAVAGERVRNARGAGAGEVGAIAQREARAAGA